MLAVPWRCIVQKLVTRQSVMAPMSNRGNGCCWIQCRGLLHLLALAWLMFTASRKRTPAAPLRLARSLPAKSTRCILPNLYSTCFMAGASAMLLPPVTAPTYSLWQLPSLSVMAVPEFPLW